MTEMVTLPKTYQPPHKDAPKEVLGYQSPLEWAIIKLITDGKLDTTKFGVPSAWASGNSWGGMARAGNTPGTSPAGGAGRQTGSSYGGAGRDAGAASPSGDRGAGTTGAGSQGGQGTRDASREAQGNVQGTPSRSTSPGSYDGLARHNPTGMQGTPAKNAVSGQPMANNAAYQGSRPTTVNGIPSTKPQNYGFRGPTQDFTAPAQEARFKAMAGALTGPSYDDAAVEQSVWQQLAGLGRLPGYTEPTDEYLGYIDRTKNPTVRVPMGQTFRGPPSSTYSWSPNSISVDDVAAPVDVRKAAGTLTTPYNPASQVPRDDRMPPIDRSALSTMNPFDRAYTDAVPVPRQKPSIGIGEAIASALTNTEKPQYVMGAGASVPIARNAEMQVFKDLMDQAVGWQRNPFTETNEALEKTTKALSGETIRGVGAAEVANVMVNRARNPGLYNPNKALDPRQFEALKASDPKIAARMAADVPGTLNFDRALNIATKGFADPSTIHPDAIDATDFQAKALAEKNRHTGVNVGGNIFGQHYTKPTRMSTLGLDDRVGAALSPDVAVADGVPKPAGTTSYASPEHKPPVGTNRNNNVAQASDSSNMLSDLGGWISGKVDEGMTTFKTGAEKIDAIGGPKVAAGLSRFLQGLFSGGGTRESDQRASDRGEGGRDRDRRHRTPRDPGYGNAPNPKPIRKPPVATPPPVLPPAGQNLLAEFLAERLRVLGESGRGLISI